jgi:DNA-binding LytR/AlgR family response regulator
MNDVYRAKFTGTGVNNSPEDTEDTPLRPTLHTVMVEKSAISPEPLPRAETPQVKPIKIAIKTKGKILLIHPGDILAVEAEGNYVLLRRSADSYLLRESISTMAEKLHPYGFVRIHRSVLVNASAVEEIQSGTNGEYVLRISGGREYMVSRTFKNNLKSLAHSWIGTDSFVND